MLHGLAQQPICEFLKLNYIIKSKFVSLLANLWHNRSTLRFKSISSDSLHVFNGESAL